MTKSKDQLEVNDEVRAKVQRAKQEIADGVYSRVRKPKSRRLSAAHMDVRVTIDLSIAAQEKHFEQMRSAASYLTDDRSSVKVSYASDDRKKLTAAFTFPTARQADVVDSTTSIEA